MEATHESSIRRSYYPAMHKFFLFIICLVIIWRPCDSEARPRAHTPHRAHHESGVDSGAGYSDIVIDAETGRVVHDTDSDSLRHPASLTKMMTLYITFQALESGKLFLNEFLPVSENASYQSPSKLGLHAGQRIRVEDAILGVVTESANDAAVVLGEAMGGSEDNFAQLMTKQARALGMTRTVFRNPSGLPNPDQVTTAHDMAILGAALLHHYPEFYPYFSHDSFTYAGIFHHNHNHLMDRYEGMDGIKTGYIRASGFNLVASARHGNIRLIGVVFGGRSAVARDNHMAQLLDESFDVAQTERRTGRVASESGEGDSSDNTNTNSDYIALPAKISAVFGGRSTSIAQASEASPAVAPMSPPAQTQPRQESQSVQIGTPSFIQQPLSAPAPQLPPTPKQVAMLTPPAAPAPSHAMSNGSWGIQIGAYSDSAIGQAALSSLTASMPDLLTNSDPEIQKITIGNVVMYRARVMALDKKTAQTICSFLIQHGKSCLTVEP